jgi:hypothetical protein
MRPCVRPRFEVRCFQHHRSGWDYHRYISSTRDDGGLDTRHGDVASREGSRRDNFVA